MHGATKGRVRVVDPTPVEVILGKRGPVDVAGRADVVSGML